MQNNESPSCDSTFQPFFHKTFPRQEPFFSGFHSFLYRITATGQARRIPWSFPLTYSQEATAGISASGLAALQSLLLHVVQFIYIRKKAQSPLPVDYGSEIDKVHRHLFLQRNNLTILPFHQAFHLFSTVGL